MILASGSPQRRAILEQLGVAFEVIVPDVDELTSGPPEEVVLENAHRKASAVAERRPDARLVLGVDTEVALGSRVYGKPGDRAAALEMLELLAGREHRVISGVCVIAEGRIRTAASATTVRFRELGPQTLDWYVETGEWQGRAGGYAIQGRGAALVERLDGDYLNVVGLPVATLLDLVPQLLFEFPAVS